MRKLVLGVLVFAAWCGSSNAGGVRFPSGYNPQSGQAVPYGNRDPITLRTVPAPKFSPVVGSVTPHGHFVNPITGRAKYRGTAMDPGSGRLYGYKFRQ